MIRLKNPEAIDASAALKAKMERLKNPVPKALSIPKTKRLKPGDPINEDLARLSFRREGRTQAMVRRIAEKHCISVGHVYRLLQVYEDTHVLEFPGDPAKHWKNIMGFVETGVATNGNRRVPIR